VYLAKLYGAAMLLVLNDDMEDPYAVSTMAGETWVEDDTGYDIYAAMVSYHAGEVLRERLQDDNTSSVTGAATGTEGVQVAIIGVPETLAEFDASVLVLFALAVSAIIIGAYWSSDTERKDMHTARRTVNDGVLAPLAEEEIHFEYLSEQQAWSFVLCASLGLILMFFLIDYIIYILVVFFAISGTEGMSTVLHALYSNFIQPERMQPTWVCSVVPCCLRIGYTPRYDSDGETWLANTYTVPYLVSFTVSLVVSIIWLIWRREAWAWVLQDMMGFGLLLLMQKLLRLRNAKTASILLIMAFFYDIFWVFVSPLIFESSVMVTVATGGDSGEPIPMLLACPKIGGGGGGLSMLGLGDIALPGLFLSFLLRYDYKRFSNHKGSDDLGALFWMKNSYFVVGVVMYIVGLAATDFALFVMQMGQPALLYLVPCTLGVTVILAYKRGDLSHMWSTGIDDDNSNNSTDNGNTVEQQLLPLNMHSMEDSNPSSEIDQHLLEAV
jgi:signal peptide peptidase-like protein 2B